MAEHLSNGRLRIIRGISRACQVFQFITYCPVVKGKAKILVTSTLGHIFGLTFQNQRGIDPEQLFDVPTVKEVEETSQKMRVVDHLKELSKDCQYLMLWLDCDREGENICYEVMSVCRENFPDDRNIYRAKFSALTEVEIKHAFKHMQLSHHRTRPVPMFLKLRLLLLWESNRAPFRKRGQQSGQDWAPVHMPLQAAMEWMVF